MHLYRRYTAAAPRRQGAHNRHPVAKPTFDGRGVYSANAETADRCAPDWQKADENAVGG